MTDNRPWLLKVGDLLSQALNTIIFNGTPDESISGRSYRQGVLGGHRGWARMRRFVDRLFSIYEQDHCKKAYVADLERAHRRLVQPQATEKQVEKLFCNVELSRGLFIALWLRKNCAVLQQGCKQRND